MDCAAGRLTCPHISRAAYVEAVNKASMMLLSMSYKPELTSEFLGQVFNAAGARGILIDDVWIVRRELEEIYDAIVARSMAILAFALQERLPGVVDEIDTAFGEQLRSLLSFFTPFFLTL